MNRTGDNRGPGVLRGTNRSEVARRQRRPAGLTLVSAETQQTRLVDNSTDTNDQPFFIGHERAMVSLGPLNDRAYCPYRCAFCYVQGPFPRYRSMAPTEIVSWLSIRRSEYNVVYVSGDTDSFARPRTSLGLELLECLVGLDVDVLFTSRYVFESRERARLARVAQMYRDLGRLLIPCISISQISHPELEPRPVPTPQRRFDQLSWMTELGLPTILTIRPFIPGIGAEEYVEIAERGIDGASVVLGGDLYVDRTGCVGQVISRARVEIPLGVTTSASVLDFSHSSVPWDTLRHHEAVESVGQFCASKGVPFFMRSSPAVDCIRDLAFAGSTARAPSLG